MMFNERHVFLVSAVLGIIATALLLRDKFFNKEATDYYPVKGGASRTYPGRLPSSLGLTADEAPAIPVAASPGSLPSEELPWAHIAKARFTRMGFR